MNRVGNKGKPLQSTRLETVRMSYGEFLDDYMSHIVQRNITPPKCKQCGDDNQVKDAQFRNGDIVIKLICNSGHISQKKVDEQSLKQFYREQKPTKLVQVPGGRY